MSEPVKRDVYFWSQQIGLWEFRNAQFSANAETGDRQCGSKLDPDRTVTGLIDASPTARCTLDLTMRGPLVRALNVVGLLWTATPVNESKTYFEGCQIHDMIPAMMTSARATAREGEDGRVVYDVELCWCQTGPFVAEGFSRPELIEKVRS